MMESLKSFLHFLLFILAFYSLFQGFEGNVIRSYQEVKGKPYSVTYDRRSLKINNKNVLILSGSLHYPRATQSMWDNLFKKAKNQGLNCIQTYVFWNIHEKKQGVYDFSGRADLELFLQLAAKNDLFIDLRIGPYICSEWNFGGLPLWVKDLPDIKLRTYNPSWLKAMQRFVTDLVDLVRPYLASNGGPIILAQIENEYGTKDEEGQKYVQWCGDLIDSLNTQIPWIMCNGLWANNTIETCNGCDCENWPEEHWKQQPDKPAFWTENTEILGYELWGFATVQRPPEDVAWVVSRFIQVGGSYNNYYMWYGGNSYGSYAASGMTVKYGNGTNIHNTGIINEPKYSHMAKVHKLFLTYADILVGQAVPAPIHLKYWNGTSWVVSTQQEAYVYKNTTNTLILISSSSNNFVRTLYNDKSYDMAPKSIVVLDGSENIIFNTSKVENVTINTNRVVLQKFAWKWWNDRNYQSRPAVYNSTPMEQLDLTRDESDYLFYTRNISVSTSGQHHVVVITRKANAFLAFVDGILQSYEDNHEHSDGDVSLNLTLNLPTGDHELTLLSVSLGIINAVGAITVPRKGIVGTVTLDNKNITSGIWKMQPKLAGEWLNIYTLEGTQFVNWNSHNDGMNRSLTWYQTTFKTPTLDGKVIVLRVNGLHRGHIYLNGYDVAHYWTIIGSCTAKLFCTHFIENTCGQPSQIEYHLPPDWFTKGDNLLTIFEEIGGNPSEVELVSYDDVVTPH